MAKPSLGVSAPASPFFTPASDQTTVSHIKVTVQSVTSKPDGSLHLDVTSGNVRFGVTIFNLPGRPDFKKDDRLILEYPKGTNPLADYTAGYYEALKPQPQPKKVSAPMNAIATVTMTSLEMVDYINSERKEKALQAGAAFPSKGHAELRHDHFMDKVPEVLGEAAPKFLGTDFYTNGTGAQVERKVYTFPKREACLMAMSYSYELQAKVFDKMTALEQQAIGNSAKELPQHKARKSAEPKQTPTQLVRAMLLIGNAVQKVEGVNVALAMSLTLDAIEVATGMPTRMLTRALPSVEIDNAATLNATKVGEPLNMSSRAVNTTLEQLGFQYRDENKDWKLTEAGTAYGEMNPYHRNGHSGYEVRWKPSVVDVLRNSLKNDKEAA